MSEHDGLREALRLAVRTAHAMVYCCGHPRGGCPNHCDLLVKVIDAGRAALAADAPPAGQAGAAPLTDTQVHKAIAETQAPWHAEKPFYYAVSNVPALTRKLNALLAPGAASEAQKGMRPAARAVVGRGSDAPMPEAIEALAEKFHELYQEEAHNQGDVRNADDYADLPENIKEFDRVLARYVLHEHQRTKRESSDALRSLRERIEKLPRYETWLGGDWLKRDEVLAAFAPVSGKDGHEGQ